LYHFIEINTYCRNYATNYSILSSYTRIQTPEKKTPELSFTEAVFLDLLQFKKMQ